jgi:6-phosphogluconate dehydrogenase
MGSGLAERLRAAGHEVVGYDRDPAVTEAASLAGLVAALPSPRIVWLMVPAGAATEATIAELTPQLRRDDIVIDGGNSYYRDSTRRAAELRQQGISLLDAGTSGGIWGAAEGFCLMVGGDAAAVDRARPIFEALAPSPDAGFAHVGPSGAGHFVKMVHNGIEYGLMEAYAEGFEIMAARQDLQLDLAQVAEVWRHGSVVRSWLLDLTARALQEDEALSRLDSYVDDSGEGRWTVQESVDLAVPAPVIASALMTRFRSRQERPFSGRLLAALRNQFGGHAVKPAGE